MLFLISFFQSFPKKKTIKPITIDKSIALNNARQCFSKQLYFSSFQNLRSNQKMFTFKNAQQSPLLITSMRILGPWRSHCIKNNCNESSPNILEYF